MTIYNVSRADLLYLLAATNPPQHKEVARHCGYVSVAAAESHVDLIVEHTNTENKSLTQEDLDNTLATVTTLRSKVVTQITTPRFNT